MVGGIPRPRAPTRIGSLEATEIIPPFHAPFYGLRPISTSVSTLLILWNPHRPKKVAPDAALMRSILFAGPDCIKDWFEENSLGKFTIHEAATLGWYDAQFPWEFYWRTGPYAPPKDRTDPHFYLDEDGVPRYLDDAGFWGGHMHSWAEAIRMANKEFEFSEYDENGDGSLSSLELGIVIAKPQEGAWGTNRDVYGRQVPEQEDLVVDGVVVRRISEWYTGIPPVPATLAHELCHLFLGAGDMYPTDATPVAPGRRAGGFSIMDKASSLFHLDPYHKLKLGWLRPRVIEKSGSYYLRDVETTGDALILHNPSHGQHEFFIVENRWPGTSFDEDLPGRGIAVWHIVEEEGRANWGRTAVELLRANADDGDDGGALFDGANPDASYTLDDASHPQHLRFEGEVPSLIRIRNFSPASDNMKIAVEVPERSS